MKKPHLETKILGFVRIMFWEDQIWLLKTELINLQTVKMKEGESYDWANIYHDGSLVPALKTLKTYQSVGYLSSTIFNMEGITRLDIIVS